MMRTASAMALSSEANSPVAPGEPRVPAVMCASRVVPTTDGAGNGLSESLMAAPTLYPRRSTLARHARRGYPRRTMPAGHRPREADPLLVRERQRRREDEPRAPDEPRHARRDGQVRHPPRRPGLRARAGALVRAQPRPRTTPTTTSSSPSTPGCNAYAAPLGSLEASADKFAGQVPLILKLNNSRHAREDGPARAAR